jgi:signal transduction histidine kinase
VKTAIEDTLFGVLKARREVLVACWGAKIRAELSPNVTNAELLDEIPAFVDEIIAALYPGAVALPSASGVAEEHGAQRLRLHFDVAEVVRDYGLLHECIIEMARDASFTIGLGEQQVISRCAEHLGFMAHELRNPLSAARAAVQRLRNNDRATGRTTELLERSLRRASDMIDNALSHASIQLGLEPRKERLAVADLLRDIALDAGVEAQARGNDLDVASAGDAVVSADPRLLRSAVFNLIQNALKFSPAGSTVSVRAHSSPGGVAIDVADACGGLPPGKADDLFSPLVQRGENRSGFGLGLAIARQAVEAHGGHIGVHDIPGTGCVFTIELGCPQGEP